VTHFVPLAFNTWVAVALAAGARWIAATHRTRLESVVSVISHSSEANPPCSNAIIPPRVPPKSKLPDLEISEFDWFADLSVLATRDFSNPSPRTDGFLQRMHALISGPRSRSGRVERETELHYFGPCCDPTEPANCVSHLLAISA